VEDDQRERRDGNVVRKRNFGVINSPWNLKEGRNEATEQRGYRGETATFNKTRTVVEGDSAGGNVVSVDICVWLLTLAEV
jgi:hypothetical protein